MPASRTKLAIAEILARRGLHRGFEELSEGQPQYPALQPQVRRQGARRVSGLKRVSKPGLRVYAAKTEIPRVLGGLGVVIVSTSQGIMTGSRARKAQLGGEVLAYVW